MKSENIKECIEDLKKLNAFPPYGVSILYNDNYFWKSIKDKYTEKTIKKAEKEINRIRRKLFKGV